jgi:hypothetical protein
MSEEAERLNKRQRFLNEAREKDAAKSAMPLSSTV